MYNVAVMDSMVNNVKIGHRRIGCEDVKLILLAQDRVHKAPDSVEGGEFLDRLTDYEVLTEDLHYEI
jgi:hypothetical protein